MKPKNFPGRKLLRKANAENIRLTDKDIIAARATRTKKDRSARGRISRNG